MIEDSPELPIKTNNSKGFMWGGVNDGVDISNRMKYHRGTVQKQISGTLTTNNDRGVIVKDD